MKNTPRQKVRIGFFKDRYEVSPTTIYRWIKSQGFPKPTKLSPSCSVWDLAEVEAWEASRERMEAQS